MWNLSQNHIPFSLSTRNTITTSFLPTRISFWILLILLRESSESNIIPSILSYSSCSDRPASWAIDKNMTFFKFLDNTYQLDIGTHLSDLAHLNHDQFINFRILFSIVPHRVFRENETAKCKRPWALSNCQQDTFKPCCNNTQCRVLVLVTITLITYPLVRLLGIACFAGLGIEIFHPLLSKSLISKAVITPILLRPRGTAVTGPCC